MSPEYKQTGNGFYKDFDPYYAQTPVSLQREIQKIILPNLQFPSIMDLVKNKVLWLVENNSDFYCLICVANVQPITDFDKSVTLYYEEDGYETKYTFRFNKDNVNYNKIDKVRYKRQDDDPEPAPQEKEGDGNVGEETTVKSKPDHPSPTVQDEYSGEYIVVIGVLTAFFGIIGILGPLLVKKGHNQSFTRCCIMLAAFYMWMLWVTIYISGLNPMITPYVDSLAIGWLTYRLGEIAPKPATTTTVAAYLPDKQAAPPPETPEAPPEAPPEDARKYRLFFWMGPSNVSTPSNG